MLVVSSWMEVTVLGSFDEVAKVGATFGGLCFDEKVFYSASE